MLNYSLHLRFVIVQLLQKLPLDGWLDMHLNAGRVDAIKHETARSFTVPAQVLP